MELNERQKKQFNQGVIMVEKAVNINPEAFKTTIYSLTGKHFSTNQEVFDEALRAISLGGTYKDAITQLVVRTFKAKKYGAGLMGGYYNMTDVERDKLRGLLEGTEEDEDYDDDDDDESGMSKKTVNGIMDVLGKGLKLWSDSHNNNADNNKNYRDRNNKKPNNSNTLFIVGGVVVVGLIATIIMINK